MALRLFATSDIVILIQQYIKLNNNWSYVHFSSTFYHSQWEALHFGSGH